LLCGGILTLFVTSAHKVRGGAGAAKRDRSVCCPSLGEALQWCYEQLQASMLAACSSTLWLEDTYWLSAYAGSKCRVYETRKPKILSSAFVFL